jgi:hypothetical protein
MSRNLPEKTGDNLIAAILLEEIQVNSLALLEGAGHYPIL